ncbi:SDR family oxidoreductase, partial [Trichococcus sp.]
FYKMALLDEELFKKKMLRWLQLFPKKVRSGVAYGISKHFVIWLAQQDASRFGEKGIRVLSVTPGNFETPMGELEAEEAQTYLKYNAIKRLGKVDEIAQLFAACLDERMGYLTGTDIVCDGGCIASGVGPFTRK